MTAGPAIERLLDDPLLRRSVAVLRDGQSASGAFVASPSFPTYNYAWLRDGSFCAHALDVVGDKKHAAAFHAWVARSVESHRALFESTIERLTDGEQPPPEDMPPARYTLDGNRERSSQDDPWPNFQVDGYGMWLWAIEEHLAGHHLDASLRSTVDLVARYLESTWRLRCFNCWEEYDDGEHASTLAAVVAGLEAAGRLLEEAGPPAVAAQIRARLLERFVSDGRFRRGPSDDRVDGSLAWLVVPFAVLPIDDARIVATLNAMRADLCGPDGGIYRYRGDTYYGGGQWLLLTSSLAWHEAVAGDRDSAAALQAWVRGCASTDGALPEQVTDHAQDPAMVEPWVRRWGPVATPLLWSHAMFVIAEAACA
jgi:GH15 family glucan-1,4-alpha-glucosidase